MFTPGAQVEGFGSVPDGSDPATFVTGVSKRLAGAISIHHVHEPESAVSEPEHARGIWPMMDYVEFQAGGQTVQAPADRGWIGWGYDEEDYVRVDGTWLIS